MKNDSIKKYLIPNIPYLFVLWAFLKLGTAYRLAAGADFAHKLMGLGQTICPAFADFAPGLSACWPGQKSLWSSGKFLHQSVTPPPFALGQIVSKSRYRSSWCFSASRRNPSFEEPSIIS